ncbi:phosphotransferase [Actinokineospora terrae]|uniref:Phosphotransferase enzyme family protein n=1 Tax=Actinokineospora terrae TaxID=155974 RepID=A0A1H9VX16_9PSEU|nr:phosphotransferase [Actinokineospora terrae]SES26069.1 Phosphotransferase enzyme family protein [Actinokineospora terrae]
MDIETWQSAAWQAGAVDWLDERLADAGITRVGPLAERKVRSWAGVFTAPTTAGPVWLKAANPHMAAEVRLYEVLHAAVPERVLAPIATDPARGWLVLPDGGPTLAEMGEMVDYLPAYGQMQRDLAPHTDAVLAAGVPDMRPSRMPERFTEALAVVDDVPADIAAMGPKVAEWCARLAESPVPVSIDHNDLHAGNFLRDGRFYDWGDSVVAHSFASMLVPLSLLGTDGDRGRDAYLEAFTDLAPRAELLADLALACRVGKIARALTWHRALAGHGGPWADAPRAHLVALAKPSFFD